MTVLTETSTAPEVVQVSATEFDRRTGLYRHLVREGTRVEVVDRWGQVTEVLVRPEAVTS